MNFEIELACDYYDLGGALRSQRAAQTLAWIKPFLPQMGITRVANITGLDNLEITVTTCMRPNAKHLSVSQGKGLTTELAEISAIMESIEGFHAENPPPIDFISSYNKAKLDLKNKIVNPNCFNKGVLTKINLEDYPLAWVEASHLITKEKHYIPHILICIDSTIDRPEYAFINVSSNGLAAGNCLEEALCHALYEIIERDALYRWQHFTETEKQCTRIDPLTIKDKINSELLEKIKKYNLNIKLWNITSLLGVPAFHCSIYDENIFRGLKFFTGTGAHLSKPIALSRAITEAVQGRLTYISGNRDDVFIDYYQDFDEPLSQETNISFLNYDKTSTSEFKTSFSDNVEQLIQILKEHNFHDIFYVNHTKPDLKIPVIHVFVPGLEFNGTRM